MSDDAATYDELAAALARARAAEGRYEQLVDALGLIETTGGRRVLPSADAAIDHARDLIAARQQLVETIERIQGMIDEHTVSP